MAVIDEGGFAGDEGTWRRGDGETRSRLRWLTVDSRRMPRSRVGVDVAQTHRFAGEVVMLVCPKGAGIPQRMWRMRVIITP